MLQLFIGMPWISTYTAATAAQKRLEDEARKSESVSSSQQATRLAERITEIEEQIGQDRG